MVMKSDPEFIRLITGFNKAVELNPNLAATYFNRGLTYYEEVFRSKGIYAVGVRRLASGVLRQDPRRTTHDAQRIWYFRYSRPVFQIPASGM